MHLFQRKAVRCSITGHMNLFPQSPTLHYCEETRQKVHSSHKTVTKADRIFPLARSFPNHATYGYAFNKKLCSKGNREFVLIGTRCWMDKLLFLFLPRYEINHMTKRKGCKQPTQARNRSFQGNASVTDNFAKQLLAIRIPPNCFTSDILTKLRMEVLVYKVKRWLVTPVSVWEVCNSETGQAW